MKRVNNIYEQITLLPNIMDMYDRRVKLNTRNKTKIEKFDDYYTENMINIKNILETKAYHGGSYNLFVIKEPKVRLIMSQNISDKIINHLVSQYFLVNIFDSSLIDENVSTRIGKGSHYGIKLLKKYINELKNDNFYVLRFDIKKFFFNLDHDIIKKLVRKKIKDKYALEIIDKIVDSTDSDEINVEIERLEKEYNVILPRYYKGKGLPIGNMSSQIISVLYLNELDHYIKENLHIKYYLRYCDDGILLHKDKDYLKYCLKEIEKIIAKYKLELNNKTEILNAKQGFDFLGFRYYIKNGKVIMKVKSGMKRRIKRKFKGLNKRLVNKKITLEYYLQVENSYKAHLSYGNCRKFIKNNIDKYNLPNCDIGTFIYIDNNGEIAYEN